jgi:nitroimidazol reductase NimA-like FMN-containing flavoprotein (pyridoxamine 5'-phosphate oxidase superfamily)
MQSLNLDPQVVIQALETKLDQRDYLGRGMKISEPLRVLLSNALKHSRDQGRRLIESKDLFYALFTDSQSYPVELLSQLGADHEIVMQKITNPSTNEPTASRPHMPGYGILDADKGKGLLPWAWATERLARAHTYWVATTRTDGAPHVMPVWGVWLDDKFFFSTGSQSRKARNLSENPRCVIACELEKDQLMVEGVAELITVTEMSRRFAEAYGPKYEWDMEGFSEPVYAVQPRVVFGFTTAEEFTSTATRWTFE